MQAGCNHPVAAPLPMNQYAAPHHLALPEEEEGGHRTDTELRSKVCSFVNVDLQGSGHKHL